MHTDIFPFFVDTLCTNNSKKSDKWFTLSGLHKNNENFIKLMSKNITLRGPSSKGKTKNELNAYHIYIVKSVDATGAIYRYIN